MSSQTVCREHFERFAFAESYDFLAVDFVEDADVCNLGFHQRDIWTMVSVQAELVESVSHDPVGLEEDVGQTLSIRDVLVMFADRQVDCDDQIRASDTSDPEREALGHTSVDVVITIDLDGFEDARQATARVDRIGDSDRFGFMPAKITQSSVVQ